MSYAICLSLWLISLSIIIYSCIHVAINGIIYHFLWLSNIPLYTWTSEVAQSCPTLCNPMNCSLPDSSVHGILQARIPEWVTISFSRGSSQPGTEPISCIAGRFLLSEPPSKPFLGVMKDKSEQHYLARYPCVLFSSWQKLEEKLCQKLAVMEFI